VCFSANNKICSRFAPNHQEDCEEGKTKEKNVPMENNVMRQIKEKSRKIRVDAERKPEKGLCSQLAGLVTTQTLKVHWGMWV